jgi:hypothetical protein
MDNIGSPINNHTKDLRVLINPPPQLTMDTHIPTRIETLDAYEDNCSAERRYRVAILYITHDILKQVNLISASQSEGVDRYKNLKDQLLNLSNKNDKKHKEKNQITNTIAVTTTFNIITTGGKIISNNKTSNNRKIKQLIRM